MAVDLKKYGSEIKDACREVTGDKSETNWALFGYEGQSNVLKLVSTGKNFRAVIIKAVPTQL